MLFLTDVGTKFHLGLSYGCKIVPRYRCRHVVQPLVLKMKGFHTDNLTYGSNIITYTWMQNDTWRYRCQYKSLHVKQTVLDRYLFSQYLTRPATIPIYLSMVSPRVDTLLPVFVDDRVIFWVDALPPRVGFSIGYRCVDVFIFLRFSLLLGVVAEGSPLLFLVDFAFLCILW